MTAIQLSLLGGEQQAITSDDCYTPRWIFDTMGITFDLDPACPPDGPVNVPAARYYTAADDGLAQPWEGRVWLNPPYSKPTPWIARWIEHGNGVLLVPSSKSHWWNSLGTSAARAVYLGQVSFVRPGTKPFDIGWPIYAWGIGDECIDAISRLGAVR